MPAKFFCVLSAASMQRGSTSNPVKLCKPCAVCDGWLPMALSVNGSGASFDLTRARKRKHITDMQDESHYVALSEEEVARLLFQHDLGFTLQYLLLRLSASDNDATHLQVVLEVLRDARQNKQTEINDVDAVVDAKLREKYSTVDTLQQNFHDASTQTKKAKDIIKNVQGRFCSSVYKLRKKMKPAFDKYLDKLTDVQRADFFDKLFLQLWQQRVWLVNQDNIDSISKGLTMLTREIKPSTSAVSLPTNEQEVKRKRYETFEIPISQRDKMMHLKRADGDKYDTVMAQMNEFVQEDSQGKTLNEIMEKFLLVYEQEYTSPQKEEERAMAELMNPERRKENFYLKIAPNLQKFADQEFKTNRKSNIFHKTFQRQVQEKMDAHLDLVEYVEGFMMTLKNEEKTRIQKIHNEQIKNEMLNFLAVTFQEHAEGGPESSEHADESSAGLTARAARHQRFTATRCDLEYQSFVQDLENLDDAVQKMREFITLVKKAQCEWAFIEHLSAPPAQEATEMDKGKEVSTVAVQRLPAQTSNTSEHDSGSGGDFD